MKRLLCVLSIAASLLMTGCASDAKYSAMKETEGYDRRVNINDIRQLHQMDRTAVQDVELIRYMQRIRTRLEKAQGATCDCVVVVDSFGGYEAYSLSSNSIVVSAGLIAQAGSEDEIAAVIAHELGHVYQHDNIKGWMQEAARRLGRSSLEGFDLPALEQRAGNRCRPVCHRLVGEERILARRSENGAPPRSRLRITSRAAKNAER